MAIPCAAIPGYTLLAVFEVVVVPAWLDLRELIVYGSAALFTLTAVYCTLVIVFGRKGRETREEKAGRRWTIGLYVGIVLFCVAIAFAVGDSTWGEILNFIGGSIPLMFIFVSLYHEARFRFIDVFLKGGMFLFLTICLLSVYFAFAFPLLEGFQPTWIRPWVFALGILPLALALPWLYRGLAQWIDTRWFGRCLTTAEAIKRFLSDLGRAATEKELCEKAERGLSSIFQAPVRVDLGLTEAPQNEFELGLEVPVTSESRPIGALLMGLRANHLPYFSQDVTLLDSLSGVFSNLLENLRLQQRRLEHDRRERELSLQASQSELKALRAQINPHFLFNALNAIAGLIHKDPLRADQTVEQLSEIFRYTLRGSESEWATLEQELDFVRAYLEVEQARFNRLQVRVTMEPAVRQASVPAMLVHTLVENAVKHGITRMRGPALIEVEARQDADRLIVEVRDNGPGLSNDASPRPGRARSGGYGLRNVRDRLAGHFGDRARLEVLRDEKLRLTVASLDMPLAPARPSADGVA
jgi:two-component sensor histidine kinase